MEVSQNGKTTQIIQIVLTVSILISMIFGVPGSQSPYVSSLIYMCVQHFFRATSKSGVLGGAVPIISNYISTVVGVISTQGAGFIPWSFPQKKIQKVLQRIHSSLEGSDLEVKSQALHH